MRLDSAQCQARKVVSDIYEQLHGEQIYHASVRKFFTDWLAHKKAELEPGSYKRYVNAVDKLLVFWRSAHRDIACVHKRDITASSCLLSRWVVMSRPEPILNSTSLRRSLTRRVSAVRTWRAKVPPLP